MVSIGELPAVKDPEKHMPNPGFRKSPLELMPSWSLCLLHDVARALELQRVRDQRRGVKSMHRS